VTAYLGPELADLAQEQLRALLLTTRCTLIRRVLVTQGTLDASPYRLADAFREAVRATGCGLRSLQEPWIDTTTPVGEALYHITLAWAQLEKRQLAERVRAGLALARAEGKALGRPPRGE
jgi:hypothetical protein